ncbi:hypothetical protein T439DRAFT_321806 [Meredithblackwellia eburnea MCA 4105]
MIGTIIAFLVLLTAIFLLLPPPPSPVQLASKPSRGVPLTQPGPVLAAVSSALALDGLTIIPLVHLPPIKFAIQIPLTTRKFSARIAPTASEVVFKTLRIDDFSTRSIDAFRSPVEIKAAGVQTNFTGSFGIKLSLSIDGGQAKRDEQFWSWTWRGSGRVHANLTDSRLALAARIVQKEQDTPRVEVISTRIDEGVIHEAKIQGFGIWGSVATFAVPIVKGTWLVRWPVKIIGDYLSREILEGPLVDELLREVYDFGQQHAHVETYEALVDDEREELMKTPLDATALASFPSLSSPRNDSPSSSSPSSQSSPPTTSSEAISSPPSLPPAPDSSKDASHHQLRFHSHLIGPTRLHSFPLPDFQPELYRPGGTRAKLQSFNLLTAELKLKLTKIAVSRLTFSRGSLAFDPPPPIGAGSGTQGLGGGEVIVTVEDLEVLIGGDFSLGADTTSIVSWSTGIKRLQSSGTSTTTVLSRALQLRFRLIESTSGPQEGLSAYTLQKATMTPFTSITPKFQLDNAMLDMGAEIVNAITKQLATQIAQAVSAVLGVFFKKVVREYLQGIMDGIEGKLEDVGVRLPSGLRGEAKGEASS